MEEMPELGCGSGRETHHFAGTAGPAIQNNPNP